MEERYTIANYLEKRGLSSPLPRVSIAVFPSYKPGDFQINTKPFIQTLINSFNKSARISKNAEKYDGESIIIWDGTHYPKASRETMEKYVKEAAYIPEARNGYRCASDENWRSAISSGRGKYFAEMCGYYSFLKPYPEDESVVTEYGCLLINPPNILNILIKDYAYVEYKKKTKVMLPLNVTERVYVHFIAVSCEESWRLYSTVNYFTPPKPGGAGLIMSGDESEITRFLTMYYLSMM